MSKHKLADGYAQIADHSLHLAALKQLALQAV